MQRALIIISVLAASIAMAACNTIKGIGQDVQKAGQAIEGAGKK